MLALIAVLASVVILGTIVFGNDFQHLHTIMVTATGTASASPSVAMMYIMINGTGNTAALANTNLSASVEEFNATIMPFLNGNVSKIQTQSYQVYQPTNCTYSNLSYQCKKLDYYVATESVLVTIPNIGNASEAAAQLLTIPNLQLQSVQAVLSDSQKTALNQQALSKALENATSQATALAGNERVVVENITVQSSYVYYPYALNAASGASGSVARAINSTAFYGGTASAQKSIYVVFSTH